ncbi:glycosyltransferase family A protein [Blastococcus sp. Marseille-P5729]|uniref:glycosyltransferase family A protein n=1 Tax=Blastococcus sp. Marseille-P5729 TaxID=2086582 RepID=UPI000D1098E2|nr:glycosyltransferase family A protein [Blastococcus sp. Marseille-P5729]
MDEPAGAPLATVVVLTFNGARHLRRVLEAVVAQRLDEPFETLVLDSGSTDQTLRIIAQFPGVRLHEIPNSRFQHGATRNLAARLAAGTYVVYLTQDAIPIGDRWLHEMLEPMRRIPEVKAVVGRQEPRAGCFPLLKREIRAVFSAQGSADGVTIYCGTDRVISTGMDVPSFYSDVNSATERALLLGPIPYREVEYAEDQLFGKDVLQAGFAKAYAGRGAVEHSNDLTRSELAKRTFDETIGVRHIGFEVPALSAAQTSRLVLRDIVHGFVDTVRDRDYSPLRKVYWIVFNPVFVITKWQAVRRSAAVALSDLERVRSRSLESSRRAAHRDSHESG